MLFRSEIPYYPSSFSSVHESFSLTNEQIDREKEAVKAYQELQRVKKAKRKRIREQKRMKKDNPVFHEEQDDTFYYIAGYTSGGAPYGVTWEEMGFKS